MIHGIFGEIVMIGRMKHLHGIEQALLKCLLGLTIATKVTKGRTLWTTLETFECP